MSSSLSSDNKTNSDVSWVEKYRPNKIADILGNEEAVSKLQSIARNGNMPNIILSGPPGTGKTTSILALAHELLGSTYKEAVLELKASSDDSGIDVLAKKIIMSAEKKVTMTPKIVILDQVDTMSSGAQQSLQTIMDIYSNSIRFALVCNTSSKIIETIQSSCAILRFSGLSDQEILDRLMIVVHAEKVPIVPEGLEAVIFTADGDMKQALNNLQATNGVFQLVNQENVLKVCDVKGMVCNLIEGNPDYAFLGVKKLNDLGYSPTDIYTTIFHIVKNYDMPEYIKLKFIKEIGFARVRICDDGAGSYVQLCSLLVKLSLIRAEAATAVLPSAADIFH